MRKSPLISALFPDVRGKVLAAAFTRPEKPWYLSELSTYLKTRPSSLQREIDSLSKAGILRQWRDGRRVYVKADNASPVFADLRGLFEKTDGVASILEQSLASFGEKIRVAFIYGSVARSEEQTESDIDLLVVGAVGVVDLLPQLRASERILGRPINPRVYTLQEFSRKVIVGDHFLTTVLNGPRIFVKGGESELEAVSSEG